MPGDVAEVVRGYLEYVSGNASRQLMWFSLVFSIWFPMRATGCLLHSLRKAFGKGQPKNILLDQLKIFLFAIWLMVSIGLTLLMITVGRRALYFVSGIITVPDGFINLWSKLRFVAVALLMFVLVTVLYMLALGRRCPLREVAPAWPGRWRRGCCCRWPSPIMWKIWHTIPSSTALSPPLWWCCCGCI